MMIKWGWVILLGCLWGASPSMAAIYQYQNVKLPSAPEPSETVTVKLSNNAYVVFLDYVSPKSIQQVLKTQYPTMQISIDEQRSAVIMTADKKDYQGALSIIRSLDGAPKQVYVHVKILELASSESQDYQQLLSQVSNGISANLDSDGKVNMNQGLPLVFKNMVDNGSATVLAKPTISVLDQEESVIKVGEKIPYLLKSYNYNTVYDSIQYLDTGVDLKLSARINAKQQVKVNLNLAINTIKSWQQLSGSRYPLLSNRQAQLTVQLNLDETLVLAGLYDESSQQVHQKVPVLGDIPLIGGLFHSQYMNKQKTDVVLLIQPTLLSEPGL